MPEYWIVDPKRKAVEILTLAGDTYTSRGVFAGQATARSQVVPGLAIDLTEIF